MCIACASAHGLAALAQRAWEVNLVQVQLSNGDGPCKNEPFLRNLKWAPGARVPSVAQLNDEPRVVHHVGSERRFVQNASDYCQVDPSDSQTRKRCSDVPTREIDGERICVHFLGKDW